MRFLIPLMLLFAFPAIAQQQPVMEEEPASSAVYEKPGFDNWLDGIKQEALAKGISQEVIDDAFEDVVMPSQDVIDLDNKQPEGTKTFSEYMEGILTEKRIKTAKENYRTHRKVLRRIEAKYHVPATVLLALWAIESNFGKNQGNYSVIESLATLAFDGRRSELFHKELLNALTIMESEGISAQELTGSWAGAMGQTQFMPSSYLKYAVDFDHDGKKDIWSSDADALASIANYLHSKGWKSNYGWGVEVSVPDTEPVDEWRLDKEPRELKEWRSLGFTREDGKPLPKTHLMARLVIPDDDSQAFLVYPNYDVIMDWNHSIYFATAVSLLSDEIRKE